MVLVALVVDNQDASLGKSLNQLQHGTIHFQGDANAFCGFK